MDLNDKTIDVHLRHTELVKNLAKPGEEILSTITVEDIKVLTSLHRLSVRITECFGIMAHASLQVINEDDHDEDSADMMHLLHMIVGQSGEHGELLDCIKKAVIYQESLNRDNAIEEIGDLLFYFRGIQGYSDTAVNDFKEYVSGDEFKVILDYVDTTVEECLEANINKLQVRYVSGKYSDKQAQDRADKS